MTNPFRIHDRIALTRVCLVVALCARSAGVVAQETGAASRQQESLKAADEQQAGNAALPTGKMSRAFSWVESRIDVRSGVRDGWLPDGEHDSGRRFFGGARLPSSSVRRSGDRRRVRGGVVERVSDPHGGY